MGENNLKELIILKPGERLREVRLKLGLTQEDLAGKNMSKNYISMFENGKRHINIINATYFAEVFNKKAREQKVDLNFEASYFIKSDKDMARDVSMGFLDKVLKSTEFNKRYIYGELYKVIYLAEKYELEDILALAYKLKGNYLYRDGLYRCAKTHFNNSLIYYIKLGDIKGIKDIYINLGKTCYANKNYEMAIVYCNQAGLIEKEDEVQYYKALSYWKLEHYEIAKNICNNIMFKDERVIDLENYLKEV